MIAFSILKRGILCSMAVLATTAAPLSVWAGTLSLNKSGAGTLTFPGSSSQFGNDVGLMALFQTIQFTPPAEAVVDEPLTLSATGGASGNPVVFSVLGGPGVVVGNELHFVGLGPVMVAANQAAGGGYDAATTVYRTILARENNPPIPLEDEVTISNSAVTLSPLANDEDYDGDLLRLVGVSDPAITMQGRDVVIPPTFSGTFQYDVTDGFVTATGTVQVKPVAPIANALRYSGLLYNNSGTISAWVRMLVNPKGYTTVQLLVGPKRGSGIFTLGPTGGTAVTSLGSLVFTRNADGTLTANFSGIEGPLHGVLRPGPATTTPERHHISLRGVGELTSSESGPVVNTKMNGGGYAIARVRRDATVAITGKLPDGTPFSAGATVSEINTIAFYVVTTINVIPRGYVGGELRKADLDRTDITGELVYFKPNQGSSKYTHRSGFFTYLLANGCLYSRVDLDGFATIQLIGGNLASDEELEAETLRGRPRPGGSLVDVVANASAGTFNTRIKVPFARKAIVGSGIFLPKTQSAWGYFGGTSVGGRIEMAIEPNEYPIE